MSEETIKNLSKEPPEIGKGWISCDDEYAEEYAVKMSRTGEWTGWMRMPDDPSGNLPRRYRKKDVKKFFTITAFLNYKPVSIKRIEYQKNWTVGFVESENEAISFIEKMINWNESVFNSELFEKHDYYRGIYYEPLYSHSFQNCPDEIFAYSFSASYNIKLFFRMPFYEYNEIKKL